MTQKIDPFVKMREAFPAHQISKLPKPTKAQTEEVKADFKKGIRCKECGAWHHPDVVHLDYVGHAALTDRMLDADIHWTWEPVAFTELGLPAFDQGGGLWIKLTIGGITRLGYGHAAMKPNADPGAREKEVIGDALRNAAMRFGAALDLWHKGDLHLEDEGDAAKADVPKQEAPKVDMAIPKCSAADVERITNLAKAADKAIGAITDGYLVDDLADLDVDQAAAAIRRLKKLIEERSNEMKEAA